MDDYKFFWDDWRSDSSISKEILDKYKNIEVNYVNLPQGTIEGDVNWNPPMNKKEIEFRDPIVERVVDMFVSRSDHGYNKYGMTLHDERVKKVKGLLKYLTDIQEELMDAVLYIQAAREEIKDMEDGKKKQQ